MKAMSLRIRMQTLSPCPTPSFSRPPAIRATRFASSAKLRFRSPLMMPRKGEVSGIVSFGFLSGQYQAVIPGRCKASNPESRDSPMCNCTSEVRAFDAPRNDSERLSSIRKARRALFDVGADRLELVGPAHQFHLLNRLGEQRRTGIDRQVVQHALAGADRFRALAGDLACDLEGGGPRIVADPGGEAV